MGDSIAQGFDGGGGLAADLPFGGEVADAGRRAGLGDGRPVEESVGDVGPDRVSPPAEAAPQGGRRTRGEGRALHLLDGGAARGHFLHPVHRPAHDAEIDAATAMLAAAGLEPVGGLRRRAGHGAVP